MMKYLELLTELYSNDILRIIAILNKSIYVKDVKENVQESSVVIHTGFRFTTHNKKHVEILYDFNSQKIIRQPRNENYSTVVPLINGVLLNRRNEYFDQFYPIILSEIDEENFSNSTPLSILNPFNYFHTENITEIEVKGSEEKRIQFIIVRRGDKLNKFPLRRICYQDIFYDGNTFRKYLSNEEYYKRRRYQWDEDDDYSHEIHTDEDSLDESSDNYGWSNMEFDGKSEITHLFEPTNIKPSINIKELKDYLITQNNSKVYIDNVSESEKELEEFLIQSPWFTKTLILLYYPFSYDELVRLKAKLAPGGIILGKYVENEFDNEFDDDDDGEYYDDKAFEFEFGLLFNCNINWFDSQIQNLLLNEPSNKYKTRGEEPSIEFDMPITLNALKEFELNIINDLCTEESQILAYDIDDFVEDELMRLGVSEYYTDEYGTIVEPPELVLSISNFLEKSKEQVDNNYKKMIIEVEDKYKPISFNKLSIEELQEIVKKDDHYLFVNRTIWQNTFSKIITGVTLNKFLEIEEIQNDI